jgi:hypothetical protein
MTRLEWNSEGERGRLFDMNEEKTDFVKLRKFSSAGDDSVIHWEEEKKRFDGG